MFLCRKEFRNSKVEKCCELVNKTELTDVFALVMQFQIPLLPGISLMALEFPENPTTMKMYFTHDVYGRSDYKMLPS